MEMWRVSSLVSTLHECMLTDIYSFESATTAFRKSARVSSSFGNFISQNLRETNCNLRNERREV